MKVETIKRKQRAVTRFNERTLVAKYLREVGENECGFSQPECDELAERVERGLHAARRTKSG